MDNEDVKKYLVRKKELAEELAKLAERVSGRGHDLGDSSLDCLLYLGAFGYNSFSKGVTKGDLKSAVGETKDITRAARRLEDKGLLSEVYFDNNGVVQDRREKRVKLTRKGERLYSHILDFI